MTQASGIAAVLIAGPTASGKSGLALRLARDFDGVIINADSMQVYRDLRVLTARPSAAEEAAIQHELYGFVPGTEAYSAGRYAIDAAAAVDKVRRAGRLPIITGGTGLYFKVLLEGLSPIPPIEESVRAHWRGEAARLGAATLHAILAQRDPAMAQRLQPTDPQRVTRALEVLEATGRSLGEWQQMPGKPILEERRCVRLVVAPDRDELYASCNARFDLMLREGALDEVASLTEFRLSPDLPIMRALGVAPLQAHLAGKFTIAEAAERAKIDTRQYAKRQLVWLRRHMADWTWATPEEAQRFDLGKLGFPKT